MAPIISQQPLFIALFSAIGVCLAAILIYEGVSFGMERRNRNQDAQEGEKRDVHPLTWNAKPSK